MSIPCFFCGGPVNPHDIGVWKRVAGWVGGPQKDGMTLRENTGEYAHQGCVNKAKKNVPDKQPALDEADAPGEQLPHVDFDAAMESDS